MHGITHSMSEDRARGIISAAAAWMRAHRLWLLIVVLPTMLAALYYCFIASDQYESEEHFLVRSTSPTPAAPAGIGAALGLSAGATSGSSDSASVADYLVSHDAVSALQNDIHITTRYSRPGIDFLSRLRPSDPSPERLLDYYRGKVEVRADPDTGVAVLRVRSFTPGDSYLIAQELLKLGERRVNSLNQRAYDSTLGRAEAQLSDAERDVADIQAQMTAFRQHNGDFNPQITGAARVEMVSALQGQLAVARAQAMSMTSQLSPDSPQVVAARARVNALETQVAAEKARLAKGQGNVATSTGTFEGLQLRQQFAAKRYDLAASALAQAREQLSKQQLFIVEVVRPNMAVKSLYPQRLKIIVTLFVGLLLAYGIGWLIIAGVREHAA